jgi:H+/Cl- antiporter ClcA
MPSRRDPANSGVPLAAIFAFLTTVYVWLLQVLILIGKHFSGGQWPAPIKERIWFGVVVFCSVLLFGLRKKYRAYNRQLSRTNLNARDTLIITTFVMIWVAMFVWLAAGPPGPEFKPA